MPGSLGDFENNVDAAILNNYEQTWCNSDYNISFSKNQVMR